MTLRRDAAHLATRCRATIRATPTAATVDDAADFAIDDEADDADNSAVDFAVAIAITVAVTATRTASIPVPVTRTVPIEIALIGAVTRPRPTFPRRPARRGDPTPMPTAPDDATHDHEPDHSTDHAPDAARATQAATPVAPLGSTARAAAYHRYGPPEEVLRLETLPTPHIGGAQDVLVRVEAAVVGSGDWRLLVADPFAVRFYQGLARIKRPVLGHGIAGRVAAVGDGVAHLRPGDRVFGETAGGGGFCEVVRTSAERLALVPDGVDPAAAAATPVAGFTALQALRDHGRLPADGRVLVIGAGGAVGSMAVAIAAHLGARVTAVDGASKHARVRDLGAETVHDRRAWSLADATATGERFDTIVDVIGDAPLAACRRALTDSGRYVAVSGPLTRTARLTLIGGPRLVGMIAKPNPDDLERLRGWLAGGVLAPRVQHRFPLDETAAALRAVGDGGLLGAVVVVP